MFGWLSGSPAAPQVPIYPEIATPKSDAEFEAVKKGALTTFDAMISETAGWATVAYGDGTTGVSVWSKALEGSSVQAAKASGVVAAPIDEVLKVCHITSDKQAVEQDADMLAWRLVKTVAGGEVVYTGHKTPYPMSHRENLFFRFTDESAAGIKKLVQQSVNDEAVPVEQDRVRSVMIIAGWQLESIEDGKKTRVTRLLQLDPKGNVPTFVVNMYIAKVGDSIVKVRSLLKVGQ